MASSKTVNAKNLETLGREQDAQEFRWERFMTAFDGAHLRAYLKKLPNLKNFGAERRALIHASACLDPHEALAFLIDWPALHRAAALVLARVDAIDGNAYELHTPAADALKTIYPLVATILLRAMIDVTMMKARSLRYGHAIRQLATYAALARRNDDWGGVSSHDDDVAALQSPRQRKVDF